MSRRHHHHPPTTTELLELILDELEAIRELLTPPFPTHFTLTGDPMTRLDPGAVPVFTATPQPAGSSLGTVIPTWTAEPSTDASISVDETGLVATVTISPSATVGDTVTLTVTASDGTTTATGTLAFVIGALPPVFPTSFSIAQTS